MKILIWGWCSSVEHRLSVSKDLNSVPRTGKRKAGQILGFPSLMTHTEASIFTRSLAFQLLDFVPFNTFFSPSLPPSLPLTFCSADYMRANIRKGDLFGPAMLILSRDPLTGTTKMFGQINRHFVI